MASTSDLIEFLLNTGYGDIPSEAIQKTKLQILDCLDVTLAASKLPITEIIVGSAATFAVGAVVGYGDQPLRLTTVSALAPFDHS